MKKLLAVVITLSSSGMLAMDTEGVVQVLSPVHSPFVSPRSSFELSPRKSVSLLTAIQENEAEHPDDDGFWSSLEHPGDDGYWSSFEHPGDDGYWSSFEHSDDDGSCISDEPSGDDGYWSSDDELVVVPKPKKLDTLEKCYAHLAKYNQDNLQMFANLVMIKKHQKKPLDYSFGFGLYQDGAVDEKISIIGMPQYFLTDLFVEAIKKYVPLNGVMKPFK